MPYRMLLESLVGSVHGAKAALLLDPEGEVVLEAGEREDRHRLVAAYQGIALSTARRSLERLAAGGLHYMIGRYEAGHVIARPLKDDYYLVVSLARDGDLAHGIHRSAETQERMNQEL
jgi:predicted regulator of Ras-like GTPase activity (Roadblock/LC7/MglB family)